MYIPSTDTPSGSDRHEPCCVLWPFALLSSRLHNSNIRFEAMRRRDVSRSWKCLTRAQLTSMLRIFLDSCQLGDEQLCHLSFGDIGRCAGTSSFKRETCHSTALNKPPIKVRKLLPVPSNVILTFLSHSANPFVERVNESNILFLILWPNRRWRARSGMWWCRCFLDCGNHGMSTR